MQIPVIRRSEFGEDNCIVILRLDEILYVSREGEGRLSIHTEHDRYYSLASLEDYNLLLSDNGFFRTDRVCIVNMDNVKKLDLDLGLIYFDDPPDKNTKFATIAHQNLRKVKDWNQRKN